MSCTYYIKTAGKWGDRIGYYCFSLLTGNDQMVRYICDHELSKEITKRYIECLGLFFPKGKFFASIKDHETIFSLNTRGMPYRRELVYLTAFRYLKERPDFVTKFCEVCKSDDPETVFAEFQNLHKVVHDPNSNHSLICLGGDWNSNLDNGPKELFKPITISQFHHNLTLPNLCVFYHFKENK